MSLVKHLWHLPIDRSVLRSIGIFIVQHNILSLVILSCVVFSELLVVQRHCGPSTRSLLRDLRCWRASRFLAHWNTTTCAAHVCRFFPSTSCALCSSGLPGTRTAASSDSRMVGFRPSPHPWPGQPLLAPCLHCPLLQQRDGWVHGRCCLGMPTAAYQQMLLQVEGSHFKHVGGSLLAKIVDLANIFVACEAVFLIRTPRHGLPRTFSSQPCKWCCYLRSMSWHATLGVLRRQRWYNHCAQVGSFFTSGRRPASVHFTKLKSP